MEKSMVYGELRSNSREMAAVYMAAKSISS
jgi:hypothetical protein